MWQEGTIGIPVKKEAEKEYIKKSIVRMYGIAIDATRAATTVPRRFFLRTIWFNTTFKHCLSF